LNKNHFPVRLCVRLSVSVCVYVCVCVCVSIESIADNKMFRIHLASAAPLTNLKTDFSSMETSRDQRYRSYEQTEDRGRPGNGNERTDVRGANEERYGTVTYPSASPPLPASAEFYFPSSLNAAISRIRRQTGADGGSMQARRRRRLLGELK